MKTVDRRRDQRGISLFVVMVLLSALLVGGVAVARFAQTASFVAGNVADKEGALNASEVAVNSAYLRLRSLPSDDADEGGWYRARMTTAGLDGLPGGMDWDKAPELKVGRHSMRYVVERLCTVAPVVDSRRDCLLEHDRTLQSAKQGAEAMQTPTAKQFKVTVRVVGPRNGTTFVQALVTRGS